MYNCTSMDCMHQRRCMQHEDKLHHAYTRYIPNRNLYLCLFLCLPVSICISLSVSLLSVSSVSFGLCFLLCVRVPDWLHLSEARWVALSRLITNYYYPKQKFLKTRQNDEKCAEMFILSWSRLWHRLPIDLVFKWTSVKITLDIQGGTCTISMMKIC